jgi:hypothetical protein
LRSRRLDGIECQVEDCGLQRSGVPVQLQIST